MIDGGPNSLYDRHFRLAITTTAGPHALLVYKAHILFPSCTRFLFYFYYSSPFVFQLTTTIMSSNTCDPLSTANTTPKPSARLTNPTTYHLQQQQEYQYQMRFKDQVGIDPTQVMEHQHLFFAQQHQESSPNLSDLDYPDLTTNTSSSGNGLTSSDPHRPSQQPPVALQHHHHFIRHHHQPSGVVDPSSTTMAPPPSSSGTNHNSPGKDLQLEEHKLQHPPAHYSHSMMYYPPPSSSATMNSQSYYYKQIHQGGVVNGATASTSFGASAPAHLGYNHMHPPPLVGHSVTPNDAAAMAMAAPAPPDNVVTGINRQHQQPHVYEQHKQQPDTSSCMDAGASEINEPYEDDFAAQAK